MRDIMKKTTLILFGIFLCVSALQGAETEQDKERLRLQVREMINAGIPHDDAENMNRMMIKHNFSYQHMIKAQQVVIDAAKQRLPFEQVMNKAYEGVAKNVPDEAIVKAMEKIRHRYAYAYEQAQQLTDDKQQVKRIGQSIVDGLKAGLNKEDADKIMLALRQQTRQMNRSNAEEIAGESFLTVGTMARLGVSSASITDITCQAIRNNYNAENMRQLHNRFRMEAMNTPPSVVAEQFRYSIHEGMMDRQLEANRQYGNTNRNKDQSGNSTGNSNGTGISGGDQNQNRHDGAKGQGPTQQKRVNK